MQGHERFLAQLRKGILAQVSTFELVEAQCVQDVRVSLTDEQKPLVEEKNFDAVWLRLLKSRCLVGGLTSFSVFGT